MQQDDVIILDGRTDYEFDLGHFKNAIRPPVKSFREFPDWVEKDFKKYKDKKVLTYCTGGVRCEKLSGYLLQQGFKDVYQLNGGIVNYSHDPEVKGKLFEGKCYVLMKEYPYQLTLPINILLPESACIAEHQLTGMLTALTLTATNSILNVKHAKKNGLVHAVKNVCRLQGMSCCKMRKCFDS
jgi:UPF0176 protein